MRFGHDVGHGSDAGRVRPLNEDFHRVWQFPLQGGALSVLAVADGMGGAAAGEVASKIATEVLDESFSRYVEEIYAGRAVIGVDKLLDKALRLANRRVYTAAFRRQQRRGMGAALTCAAFVSGRAYVGHVGDTRAFLVRAGRIYQLTRDHTWVEEQMQLGLLTEEEALRHDWKNLLTRALGTRPTVSPDVVELEARPGDVFVLSTDGLHSLVRPEEILAEISRSDDRQTNVEALIAMANERGGPDNITVVIAGVPE